MIVPTLATTIDALVIEADVYVDPSQGGDDEYMCLCDYSPCRCAGPMNGIVVRRKTLPSSILADDPFAIELDSDDPFPY